jgi:hypothetical protein
LAQARAYKQLEPAHNKDFKKNMLLYNIHHLKMEKFDLAVTYMAKIEDLFVRLLFEGLGASLVEVDMNAPDWERKLTWESFKKGLKNRKGNKHLSALEDKEYEAIRTTTAKLRNPDFVNKFVRYRDSLAHRIRPSVDYPELYTRLQSRAEKVLIDSVTGKKGWELEIGTDSSRPDHDFLVLYDLARKTMKHYISVLGDLRLIPRFKPEAAS